MKATKKIIPFITASLLAVSITFSNSAKAFDDSVALHGIQTGKAFFAANTSVMSPESFLLLLKGIILTHTSLIEQGVTPDFIVSFSGKNVVWLSNTTDPTIKVLVQQIDALGVRLEICSIALIKYGVDPETVLPQIDVVGNGWISAIAYQSKSKGYALIAF